MSTFFAQIMNDAYRAFALNTLYCSAGSLLLGRLARRCARDATDPNPNECDLGARCRWDHRHGQERMAQERHKRESEGEARYAATLHGQARTKLVDTGEALTILRQKVL